MSNSRVVLMLLGLFGGALLASRLNAEDPAPVKKLILPGEAFLVEGRPAFVLLPAEGKRQKVQPWIFYAPTLAGYPDDHEKWMHEQFLAAGVAVAGIDVGEGYGSPKGRELFSAFYKEVTEKRDFATKQARPQRNFARQTHFHASRGIHHRTRRGSAANGATDYRCV